MPNELQIARALADGELDSPQEFLNSYYWVLRISGTGVAWRKSVGEYCLREPAMWLSDEMQRRCLGLPVIMEHPTAGILNSAEFGARAVGMIIYSFVRESDLMGVARILDKSAIEILKEGADTSPAVQFAPDSGARVEIDGKPLLVEGVPMLFDHLAVCSLAEEIEHFRAVNGATRAVAADSVLAAIQSDADRASSAWGKDAPHPWDGERITAYRRRTAREHQMHSANWKDVDLNMLSGQTLRNAVSQIFADSIAASSSSESYGETLREVRRRDPDTGHLIKEYYGEPRAWMRQFAGGPPRLAKFNLDQRRDR
jgi:hypothetical protein